jgi:hypothetical protein
LLNGRILNLSYGSYAPGAPDVFIDDAKLKELWASPGRYYLVAGHAALPRLENDIGREKLNVVAESGGKYVFTNLPLANSTLLPDDVRARNSAPAGAANPAETQFHWSKQGIEVGSGAFRPTRLDGTNSAGAAQTRYDHRFSAIFVPNGVGPLLSRLTPSVGLAGFPTICVARGPRPELRERWTGWHFAPAARDPRSEGSSVPEASLHCASPEEDA